MKNIVLIGMMGSGKSTCARLLGKALGRPVVDTDRLVEELGGMSISEMFEKHGEDYMRDLETEVCRRLGAKEGLIIATGGGLPLREENRNCLRENGIVVFLNRDPGEIYDSMDTSGRPLAQQGKTAFLERFSQREPVYRAFAHVVVEEFASPKITVRTILEQLEGQI